MTKQKKTAPSAETITAKGAGSRVIFRRDAKEVDQQRSDKQAVVETNEEKMQKRYRDVLSIAPEWLRVMLRIFGLKIFHGVKEVIVETDGSIVVTLTFRILGVQFNVKIVCTVIAGPSMSRKGSRATVVIEKFDSSVVPSVIKNMYEKSIAAEAAGRKSNCLSCAAEEAKLFSALKTRIVNEVNSHLA